MASRALHAEVHTSLHATDEENQTFQRRPQSHRVQQRVEIVSDDAIMRRLSIAMMLGMMVGRLQQTEILQPRHEPTVLVAALVGPLVNLVRVHPNGSDKDNLPGKEVERPRAQQNGEGHHQENLRTLQPAVSREVRGIVVMQDVLAG